jgi:TonB family protein
MQAQTSRREAGAVYQNDRTRMFFALVILLVALVVVVVNDRGFWFSDTETSTADDASPEWVPSKVAPAPVVPVASPAKPIAVAKNFAKPKSAERPVVAITRNVIPPLEVEVVAGSKHDSVRFSSNPEKVQAPLNRETVTEQAPATAAAARVKMELAKAQMPAYPALSRQMKVEGSVLLQAFIGPDGTIQDLRVLSGPAILASAAREAARHWQFKPYLQNGRPVETQAKITVNFTIKVLENGARDQMDTVVALSSRGE